MHVEHLITRAVLTAHAVMSMLLPRQTPPLTLSQRKPFEELKQYRKFVTGNINGTTLIVPIPIEQARIILPKQYKFLDGASTWQKMLPGLEGDMYPLMLTAVYDHDVGSDGYGVNTNNFHRAAFEFPFVDRLNNGYSAFRWTGTMMMTANHIAIRGARLYDMSVIPSFFYPPNDAYDGDMNGRATFQAWSKAKKDENPKVELSIESWPDMDFIPYSMEFMRNITNQPTFAGDGNCDGYTRLFNTSLTKDEAFAPVPVRANIKANLSPVAAPDRPMEQKDVYGYRMSTVFLEPFEPAKCADLADFAGTGPGDSSPPAPPDELMPPQSDSSDEMR